MIVGKSVVAWAADRSAVDPPNSCCRRIRPTQSELRKQLETVKARRRPGLAGVGTNVGGMVVGTATVGWEAGMSVAVAAAVATDVNVGPGVSVGSELVAVAAGGAAVEVGGR